MTVAELRDKLEASDEFRPIDDEEFRGLVGEGGLDTLELVHAFEGPGGRYETLETLRGNHLARVTDSENEQWVYAIEPGGLGLEGASSVVFAIEGWELVEFNAENADRRIQDTPRTRDR